MLLKNFAPAPDLRSHVEMYRIVHFRFEAGQAVSVKAYPPRPEHCLSFYPFDRETARYRDSGKEISNLPVVVYGQFTQVTDRLIGRNFLVFQVVFYPGALFRLTGIPAHELNNQYLDGELVFDKSLHEINEQLYYANGYEAMVCIVDGFIRKLIRKEKKPSIAVDRIFVSLLKAKDPVSMNTLAKSTYHTIKQLERKFHERAGVNPKLYARIMRFDKAFRIRNDNPDFDWLRIALECGCHDYQHLAKEYKDFTGLSPNAFHQLENNAPERAFGLIEGIRD